MAGLRRSRAWQVLRECTERKQQVGDWRSAAIGLRCVADVARPEQVRLEVSLYFDELRAVLNAREAEVLLELDSRGGQKVSLGRIDSGRSTEPLGSCAGAAERARVAAEDARCRHARNRVMF